MGIAITSYTFDRDITKAEIIEKAKEIGGLDIAFDKSDHGYVFKNENIACAVSLSIDTDRKTVGIRQGSGDILFSLFVYTLHKMDGKPMHNSNDDSEYTDLSALFPIDVKKARRTKLKSTLITIILAPFSLLITALFFLFLFCLKCIDLLSDIRFIFGNNRVLRQHNEQIMLISNIIKMHDTPIKGVKKLLELYLELLTVTGQKAPADVCAKLDIWSETKSLKPLIKRITGK